MEEIFNISIPVDSTIGADALSDELMQLKYMYDELFASQKWPEEVCSQQCLHDLVNKLDKRRDEI